MKLNKSLKIVTACRAGCVRSVSARFILFERHGFRSVLSCGLEKNDAVTLAFLFDWADVILIVGSADLWTMASPFGCEHKSIHLNVGPDRWGYFHHPELLKLLFPMIDHLMMNDFIMPFGIVAADDAG